MHWLSLVFDGLLLPFRGAPGWIGMLGLSLAAGALAMLIIKLSSNPATVRRCRNRALARLLELWLYRESPVLQARALAGVCVDNLRYVASLGKPLLLSLAPMVLLLAQAHDHFSGRPLRPGDRILLEARLHPGALSGADRLPELRLSGVFEPDPPRVVAAADDAVAWRLAVADGAVAGRHTIALHLPGDDAPLLKTVAIGEGLRRLSPRRVQGFWEQILYPGEARLPAKAPARSIRLAYPPPDPWLGRVSIDGVLAFLVLTLGWGLVLKRPMKVEI